jgi:hypothetical protein
MQPQPRHESTHDQDAVRVIPKATRTGHNSNLSGTTGLVTRRGLHSHPVLAGNTEKQ